MNLNIASESISFQYSSSLKSNLEVELERLSKINRVTAKDIGESKLSEVAFKTTGLNTRFDYDSKRPWRASVVIPRLDKGNPILPATIADRINNADFYDLVKGSDKILKGTIDRQTGKVGGVFSKILSPIIVGQSIVSDNKLATGEKAAILMHELGHLFVYYEYMAEAVKTTGLLAAVGSRAYRDAPYKEKIIMLHEVDAASGIKIPDKDKIAKGSDELVSMVLIRETVNAKRSESGTDFYDTRSFEYLADQYVARHGGAVDLAKALNKVERASGGINTMRAPVYLFLEILKTLYILAGTLGSTIYFMYSLLLYGFGERRYDNPIDRTTRLRQQLIAQLQDETLTIEQRRSIVDDVEVIDKLLPELKARKTVIELFWDKVIPLGRRNMSVVTMQKEMEKIAFNELYRKSTDLRTAL